MAGLGLNDFFQDLNTQVLIHTNHDMGFSSVFCPAARLAYLGGDGSWGAAAPLSRAQVGVLCKEPLMAGRGGVIPAQHRLQVH